LILARRRLAGLSNCQFVEADAYDLAKVVCEPVDFVFLAVLGAPRGRNAQQRMHPAGVKEAVEPSGLRLVRVVEVSPYHYSAVFKRPGNATG
jgi:hypothetical protein